MIKALIGDDQGIKVASGLLKSTFQERTAAIWPLTLKNPWAFKSLRRERSSDQAQYLPIKHFGCGRKHFNRRHYKWLPLDNSLTVLFQALFWVTLYLYLSSKVWISTSVRLHVAWNLPYTLYVKFPLVMGFRTQCIATCWVSMEWNNWWAGMNTVLFIVLPFCPCLSLRPHSHCGKCERGDGRGGRLVGGGEVAWCSIHHATGNGTTVVHWEGEVSNTGRLLGQHCPWFLLGKTCLGALPEERGESTSSDETILATTRYV